MSIYALKKGIERLQDSLIKLEQENFDFKKQDLRKTFFNFKERKKSYLQTSIESNIKLIKNSLTDLNELNNEKTALKVQELIKEICLVYEKQDFKRLKDYVNILSDTLSSINAPQKDILFKKPRNIPYEIQDEITADINEIEKCFKFNCYRSAAIMCGRILETALHRKYYELTNNDLLEKAPGIGLGKIVAKLEEINVKLEPGIMQQIHLINQTRIFSVHNKKEAFYPTQSQTQAIILYTLDIIEKLFKVVS